MRTLVILAIALFIFSIYILSRPHTFIDTPLPTEVQTPPDMFPIQDHPVKG